MPEGDGVFRDSVAVSFLAKRLGLYRLALGGDADNIPGKLVYLSLFPLGDELEDIADVLRVDILTFAARVRRTVDGLFSEHDALLLAAYMDHIITVKHLDAQFVFNNAQVLVKGAEHADDMLHPFDFYGFVYHLFPFIPCQLIVRSTAIFSRQCARSVTTNRPSAPASVKLC